MRSVCNNSLDYSVGFCFLFRHVHKICGMNNKSSILLYTRCASLQELCISKCDRLGDTVMSSIFQQCPKLSSVTVIGSLSLRYKYLARGDCEMFMMLLFLQQHIKSKLSTLRQTTLQCSLYPGILLSAVCAYRWQFKGKAMLCNCLFQRVSRLCGNIFIFGQIAKTI